MKKKWIELEFEIGQFVYLKTDIFQEKRMVRSINLNETGLIYILVCGIEDSSHHAFEISATLDVTMRELMGDD